MTKDNLDILFTQYYNEAKLYTYSLTRNMPVAEDIVMDAFYKALMAKEMQGNSFKFWLLRVCRNLFLDYLKKARHRTELPDEMSDVKADAAVDRIIKDEQYAALYKAIGKLEHPYREAITLYYFDQMSVTDIGALLEKTEEYIRVILMRGRNKLKELMEVKNEI